MILRSELKKIARITGRNLFQAEKIYLQRLVLRSLYSKYDPVFKGGTALMVGWNLPRFSEDLDFTYYPTTKKSSSTPNKRVRPSDFARVFSKIQKLVMKDLEVLGIPSRIGKEEITEVGGTFRLGMQGPLYENEKSRCFIRIEMSIREPIIVKPLYKYVQSDFPDIMPFGVSFMHPQEIFAEKVRALMTRHRPRDLFDLWFLLTFNKKTMDITFNEALVQAKLDYYHVSWSKSKFFEEIKSLEPIWETQLRTIIFGQLPKFQDVYGVVEKRMIENHGGNVKNE